MNKLLIALALAPAAALVAPSVPRACVFRRLASIRSQFYIAVDLSLLRAPYRVPPRCARCRGMRTHPCGQRRGKNRCALLTEGIAGAARGQRELTFPRVACMARQRSPRRYHSKMVVGRRCRRGHATTPGRHTPRHDDAETHKNKITITQTQARDRRPVEPRHRHGPGPVPRVGRLRHDDRRREEAERGPRGGRHRAQEGRRGGRAPREVAGAGARGEAPQGRLHEGDARRHARRVCL